jgi:hypothetical protein
LHFPQLNRIYIPLLGVQLGVYYVINQSLFLEELAVVKEYKSGLAAENATRTAIHDARTNEQSRRKPESIKYKESEVAAAESSKNTRTI